jgi:hypothetical protein
MYIYIYMYNANTCREKRMLYIFSVSKIYISTQVRKCKGDFIWENIGKITSPLENGKNISTPKIGSKCNTIYIHVYMIDINS